MYLCPISISLADASALLHHWDKSCDIKMIYLIPLVRNNPPCSCTGFDAINYKSVFCQVCNSLCQRMWLLSSMTFDIKYQYSKLWYYNTIQTFYLRTLSVRWYYFPQEMVTACRGPMIEWILTYINETQASCHEWVHKFITQQNEIQTKRNLCCFKAVISLHDFFCIRRYNSFCCIMCR